MGPRTVVNEEGIGMGEMHHVAITPFFAEDATDSVFSMINKE